MNGKDIDDLWTKFTQSGSIVDYLNYKNAVKGADFGRAGEQNGDNITNSAGSDNQGAKGQRE